MKERIDRLIVAIRELATSYPWLKFASASGIGLLGGSGIITFLNRYAIYNYSVSYGGRLPAESVPYIDIAVSILSFAFLSASLLTFVVLYGLVSYIAEALHKVNPSISMTVRSIMASTITMFIVGVGSGFLTPLFSSEDLVFDINILYALAVSIPPLVVLSILIIWKSFIKPFAVIASLGLLILISSRLFDAENYASFLREIKYGGGVPVTVVTDAEKKSESGYLFLVTQDSVILWSKTKTEYQFQEIPAGTVTQTIYHEDKSDSLPEVRGSILNLFRHLWQIQA